MRITDRRFLHGPNLYASSACLMAVIDGAGMACPPGLGARLAALLPGVACEAACLADALAPSVMALQRLAGAPAHVCQSLPVARQPQARRIVCGYRTEQVARQALDLALELVAALARGENHDLAPGLARLRQTAKDHAIGTSSWAVLSAARRRGIPSLRIAGDVDLFQLGWGARQQRLHATMTGSTNSIAVGVARDPQLTRALLEQAGVPVRPLDPEQWPAGRNYRVLVTGGKVAAAAWCRPPCATADAGASGAGAEDVTDLLPEETRAFCIRAARTIGLDIAGIDIVCQDIALPLRAQGGALVAVHAAPSIRMHLFPSRGSARDAGGAIVDTLFGRDDGRIPVVAITGTNGKTTTALLVAHTARLAGLRTGVASTDGVAIDARPTFKGDGAGYRAARSVLSAPEVDFAVLETAHAGILRRGLAYDRCDVAIVLNVSNDHLGLDGIETIEDLARVKAVVARHAARAVVLNAEDDYCVAMARELAHAEVLYFSLDADNPVLLRHLAHGGRGVYLEDHTVVLATGSRDEALLDVRQMPVSLKGCARYNIANALAASAALAACGFGNAEIVAGMRSFVSDSKSNPLRSNLFDVDGVTVIVDYAHNCAAYAALAETARAMTPGRVVGVVAAYGDRRDADLVDIGRTCAAGFDDLVVYESENRGRAAGETAALLVQGARLGRIAEDRLACELHVHAAIRHALALCQPGDVLVFGCGRSISELTEALRPTRPEIAQRIEAEAV